MSNIKAIEQHSVMQRLDAGFCASRPQIQRDAVSAILFTIAIQMKFRSRNCLQASNIGTFSQCISSPSMMF